MALSWLLDTNVISETSKPRPAPDVLEFIGARAIEDTCLSVITMAELHKGVARLIATQPEKARRLEEWIVKVDLNFEGRILAVTPHIARIWGDLMQERDRPLLDTFIAATAIAHDLTLVTRNMKDFAGIDVKLINPWD